MRTPGLWYDREGNPIETFDEQGNLLIEPMMRVNRMLADYDYKVVANTTVGDYKVSTVWLGLDHQFEPDGPPLLFETMIFGAGNDAPYDEWIWRYPTEKEAFEAHCAIVKALQEGHEPEWGEQ
jgi:hypothetical protein